MSGAVRMLAYNPNDVKPGWIAFFIVMALLVATFFLWRNMNKQLGRINVPHRDGAPRRTTFPVTKPEPGPPGVSDPGTGPGKDDAPPER